MVSQACRTLDVDLIVLDLSRPLPFKLTIRSLQTAVKRGIHFELAYRIAVKGGVQARTVFFASVQSKYVYRSVCFIMPSSTKIQPHDARVYRKALVQSVLWSHSAITMSILTVAIASKVLGPTVRSRCYELHLEALFA